MTPRYKQKVGKWGIQENDFQRTSKCSCLVVYGLCRVEKLGYGHMAYFSLEIPDFTKPAVNG